MIRWADGLACRVRQGGSEALVFLHGLGGSRNSFDRGFELGLPAGFTLASVDFPGFGESPPIQGFSYAMEDLAELTAQWVERLDADRIHLVGHSMGGVVGLFLGERLGRRLGSFINLEGNLGQEDGFFSRRIASIPIDAFERHGIALFRKMLRTLVDRDPSTGMRGYMRDLERADPRALHRSASALVRESRHGDLRARFVSLPAPKAYLSGERSQDSGKTAFLEGVGIPCPVVPESGHFMMDDRPDLFWPMVFHLLDSFTARESDPF
ncbi:MAG: alpha/beta hydrolase [Desulfobacteraceae bacterium]|jgi:pimeloyl-ACP methyl ester carboxylesterase